MIHRSFRRPLWRIALLGLLVGCGSEGSSAPAIDPVGTYSIVSLDGHAIPYGTTSGAMTTTLTGEMFVIRSDGTFEITTQYLISNPNGSGTAQGHTAGSYLAQATGAIQFSPTSGIATPFSGQVVQNTLTVNYPNHVYVYKR